MVTRTLSSGDLNEQTRLADRIRGRHGLRSNLEIPAAEVPAGPPSEAFTRRYSECGSDKIDELVYQGLRLFNLDIRGKSVLLKPNIVEYIPGRPVNTDTQLIGAAAEAFLRCA